MLKKPRSQNLLALFRPVGNQRGQLVIVLPLSALIGLGGLLLWGYLRSQATAAAARKRTGSATQVADAITKRAEEIFTHKITSVPSANCPSGKCCDNLSTVAGMYRNLSYSSTDPLDQPTVAPIKIDYDCSDPNNPVDTSSSVATALGVPLDFTLVQDCLVMKTEICQPPVNTGTFVYTPLQKVHIEITRGVPDRAALSVSVSVNIRTEARPPINSLTGLPDKGNDAKAAYSNNTYTVRASTLNQYVLTLRDTDTGYGAVATFPHPQHIYGSSGTPTPSVSKPQLDTKNGNKMHMMGQTYVTGVQKTVYPTQYFFDWVISSTGSSFNNLITLDRPLLFRADIVGTSGMSNVPINASTLAQVLREGYRTGVFSTKTTPFLPIEDPGPQGDAWDIALDSNQLPDLEGIFYTLGVGSVNNNQSLLADYQTQAINSNRPIVPPLVKFNALDAYAGPAPTSKTPQPNYTVPAATIRAPNSPSTYNWDSTTAMQNSCNNDVVPPPPLVIRNPFIFERFESIITIDMGGLRVGNPSQPLIFCGLIAADQVTFKLAPGDNYFLGNIIATRLVVDTSALAGGAPGNLILVNPADNTPLPSNLFTTATAQSKTLQGFRQLASSTGHDFFVPIFQQIPQNISSALWPYRPHGPFMLDPFNPASPHPINCLYTPLYLNNEGPNNPFFIKNIAPQPQRVYAPQPTYSPYPGGYYDINMAQKVGYLCDCGKFQDNTHYYCVTPTLFPTGTDNCQWMYKNGVICSDP